jgi:hypothetical protein
LENAVFKFNDGQTVRSNKCKIVAMKNYADPNAPDEEKRAGRKKKK